LEVTAGCFTFFTTFLIFLVFGGGSFTEGASTALLLLGVLEALAALTGVAFFTSDLAYLAKTFLVLVAVFFFSVFFFFSAYFFFFYSASSFVFLILDPSFFVQGLVPFFVISRVIFRHLFFFVPFVFKFVSISWQFVLSHHISSLFFIFLLSNFHDILPTSLYIR